MNATGIPIGAAVALAMTVALLLAVLHLLRVRPRPVRVVTTLFWQQAVEQPKARTLWQRFRHPRTYALLAAIGALLALALANPQLGAKSDAISEIIVLDAGLTMGARADATKPSRFEQARDIVLAEAERLALSDNVAVVVADPAPRLLFGFDAPRPVLRRTLAELAPATLPSARAEALALAADLLRGRPAGRVLLVTDRPLDEAEPFGDRALELRTALVGDPAANAAILGVQFSPHETDPLRGAFLLRIGAWGPAPRDVEVRLARAGGAPLLSELVRLEPGRTREVRLADLPADGDVLVAELGPPDGLAADDRVSFRLPLRQTIRVAAPDGIPPALRLALDADPACRPVAESDEHDVFIALADEPPASAKPALWLPAGGRPLAPRAVTAAADSPLTAGLDFAQAECGGNGLLPLDGAALPLLRAGDDVLAEWRALDETPCLRLAPALIGDDSGVPRTAAFPVFVSRGLRQLAGWTDAPLTLSPTDSGCLGNRLSVGDRHSVGDRLSSRSLGSSNATQMALPADRSVSDTTLSLEAAAPPPLSPPRRNVLEGFEWLLAAAGVLLLVEAVLHARGRIA